jgi:hypothetical protein
MPFRAQIRDCGWSALAFNDAKGSDNFIVTGAADVTLVSTPQQESP